VLILPMPFEPFQPPKPAPEKKLNLMRTIHPEFKEVAQTWGWEMITVRVPTAWRSRSRASVVEKL
jgi:hypothetical protein